MCSPLQPPGCLELEWKMIREKKVSWGYNERIEDTLTHTKLSVELYIMVVSRGQPDCPRTSRSGVE